VVVLDHTINCALFISMEVGLEAIWVSFYGSKSMLANWGAQSLEALWVFKDL
jgi:hypothetical protein